MKTLDKLPNKKAQVSDVSNAWPEFDDTFELNEFYRSFSSAEGWLGDSYIIVWSRKEIEDFRIHINEAYPKKYHFFGSDGGGTQFGFFVKNGVVSYVSAPNIGGEEDIRVLGSWDEMISCVEKCDYI